MFYFSNNFPPVVAFLSTTAPIGGKATCIECAFPCHNSFSANTGSGLTIPVP